MAPAGLHNWPFPGSPTKLQTAKTGGTKPIAIHAACNHVAAGPFAHKPAENGQQGERTAPQSIIKPSSILSPEAPDSMDAAEVLGSWMARKVSFCPADHIRRMLLPCRSHQKEAIGISSKACAAHAKDMS